MSEFNSDVQLVSFLKDIRANAVSILRNISINLVGQSDLEVTPERRKIFVDACENLAIHEVNTCTVSVRNLIYLFFLGRPRFCPRPI